MNKVSKKKIAVIGSGIAGISASYFLSSKYDVHLFEQNNYLGGHTRTVKVKTDNNISIDTGFIVFNDKNYPDLIKFFDHLNVQTMNSDMSFAKFRSDFVVRSDKPIFSSSQTFSKRSPSIFLFPPSIKAR